MRVAIIGAGLAGITAGQTLRAHGLQPVVFDKGRGIGGRLATRRGPPGVQFDHGAPHLRAQQAGFASVLRDAVDAGAAQGWTAPDMHPSVVGVPGISAVAKHLAQGLDIRLETEVRQIAQTDTGWTLDGDDFDRLILTVPTPQAQQLAGAFGDVTDALAQVNMAPNLTLMLALPQDAVVADPPSSCPEGAISSLILDNDKTGRTGPQCWVARASDDWSISHLETEKDALARLMLPLVERMLGITASNALYVAAHRWRYAQCTVPLGQPFLSVSDSLFVGADWSLGPTAEDAWRSGRAMADAVVRTL